MASWLAEFPLRPPYASYQPLIFSSSFFFIFLLRMRHVAISLIISLFVINTKEAAAFFMRQPLYLFPILLHRSNIDQRQLLRPVLQAGCQRRSGI